MEETNKKYTARDFARYHSGAMATNEMHAIEKAALEDPFLADALEGYLNAPDFERDVAELKIRLSEKEKNKKLLVFRQSYKTSGGVLLRYLLSSLALDFYFTG